MPRRSTPSSIASPFAVLERTFALLSAGPRPLALDGTEIDGLPDRLIPLAELRPRLLHPSVPHATRDAALDILIRRAQAEGGAWTVGLAGVLLPGMRRSVASLAAACRGREADLEAEMLAGLLAAIAECKPGRPRPAGFLCGRAFDAAKDLVRAELAERARPGTDPVSAEPPKPFGHPDFVLARAVRERVVTRDDAELVGSTRLGEVSLVKAAAVRGLSYAAAERRRHRAEMALLVWIRSGFVEKPAVPAGSKGAGRPRQGHRSDQAAGISPTDRNAHPAKEVHARLAPGDPGPPAEPTDAPAPDEVITTTNRRHVALALRALPLLPVAAVVAVWVAQPAGAAAPTPPTLTGIIDGLRTWLVGVLAGLATLFLTIGGIRYLVAGGDPAEVERAKSALRSAAVGYALAALAPLIVSILQSVVG